MKSEFVFKIKLTPEYVKHTTGVEIPLEEWGKFCQEFERWYLLEYDGTIEWMVGEWENIKAGSFD